MASRYEQFNEMTFEAYCKAAIDYATSRERMRKLDRHQLEQTFSEFPEAMLEAIAHEDIELDGLQAPPVLFEVLGEQIPLKNRELAQALMLLLPREREIVVLRYFLNLRDEAIARRLNMKRSTVQRRRRSAEQKIRKILEDKL